MEHGTVRNYDLDEADGMNGKTACSLRKNGTARYMAIGALAVFAVLSFFLLGAHFSSPDTYAGTIESLDAKKSTVMELVGASTAASGAITLLPGDAGTPIAEKLVDLSSDFLIVLCAIYLEKYLLTVLGFAAFKILIPAACALGIAALLAKPERWRKVFLQLAAKLALLGIATFLLVPTSVLVSNMIESTYQDSIDETLATAQQSTQELETANQESASGETAQEEEGGSFLENLMEPASSLVENLTTDARAALANLQDSLNKFIEALALMIVTSCVIPIVVLLFFLWIVKAILGINVQVPMDALRPRSLTRR